MKKKSFHVIQRQDTINTLLFGSQGRLDNSINKVLIIAATPESFPLKSTPYFPFQISLKSVKGQ